MTQPITTALTEQTAEVEPDLRQALAAELHRIADDIAHLPLGRAVSAALGLGILNSRADLDAWAEYLGSPVQIDGNAIPHVEHRIQLVGHSHLTVQVQSRREHRSEVEALRARVAELEAQQAGGAR